MDKRFKRRWTRLPSGHLLFAAPFLTAAGMLAFGVLLLSMDRAHSAARAEASRHDAGLTAVGELYLTLRYVESSQRGYLLTADPAFRAEFESGQREAEAQRAVLPRYAATPAEAAFIAAIDSLVQVRLTTSREVLATAERDGVDAAAETIAEGAGHRAMTELRNRLVRAGASVAVLQQEQQQVLQARYRTMRWFIAGGTGFAALAGLLTGTALLRYGRQRDRAVAWLDGSNEQLRDQAEELEAQALELEESAQELEESARELTARGEHFQALVEEASDMIFEVDHGGRVRYASPGALRALRYEADALTGRAFADLLHADDRDDAGCAVYRLLNRRQQEVSLDCRMQAGDGSWRQVRGQARDLLDRPAIRSIVINCRDVTHERDVEAQLRQAQKMEAVGQLAGGVAHDFNNLLTTIRGYATFAADSLPDDSPAREDVAEVIQAADLAAALTRQLLAFSRKQVTKPQVVDVNAAMRDSVGMLQRLLGSSIEMVTRLGPSVRPVLIDDGQLRQVIMNLAVNARDAMPEGGRLVIETESVEIDAEHAERRGVGPGPYTMLSVTDEGEGIPAEVRERIFEPFFTTKEQGRGTGLGLSTAYGIVRQAGGYIWVYSEPGSGSTFKIYLPVVGSEAEPRDDATPSVPHRRAAHEIVLLVEDDDAVRAFAERALARSGYRVLTATDADAALRVLAEAPEPIPLVVTDVIMPGMSGAALGREVERRYPETRLLYTSGYPREEMWWRGSIPPNASFVAKPYSSDDLLAAVGQLLDEQAAEA